MNLPIYRIHMGPARCAADLTVGSELTLNLYGEPVTFTVKGIAVNDGLLYADSKESFGAIVSYRFMNEKAGSPDACNVMYA